MKIRFHVVTLALLAGFCFACSSGTGPSTPSQQNPVIGDDSFKFVQADKNTLILGAWDVMIDPASGKVEATMLRGVEQHYNVTPLLVPPKCTNCFLVKNLSYESSTQVVTVDIGFRNPSNLTGFDVRGIITAFGNMELRNPDAYIDLFSPVAGKINPFVAYITGVGQREFTGQSAHYETLQIYDPNFPKFASFKYVVEASFPSNCREPYDVSFFDVSGNLYSDGSNTQQLRILARDWQNDVAGAYVDLTPVGEGVVALTADTSLQDAWKGDVHCAPGTLPGTYKVQIWATTAPVFDQVSTLYNYLTLTVSEPPPGSEVEVFNPQERLTDSPGESFIWPRHAIAVTSDGVAHAVWVDNSPDPESNEFHVYYSKRVLGSWTSPKQVDSAQGRAIYATIAADEDDVLHVVWEDERNWVLGSDIYYATSADNFGSEGVIVVGKAGFRNVHPKIAIGSDGTLHMAWHSSEFKSLTWTANDLFYSKSTSGGSSWDSPKSIVSEELINETYPSVVPASDGGAYIAFESKDKDQHSIYFTQNLGGTFIDPVVVTSGNAFQPEMDITPTGGLVLVYQETLSGPYSDIFLKASPNSGISWSAPQQINVTQDGYETAPDVECSLEGDVHVAWHEEDKDGHPGKVFYREFITALGWLDVFDIVGAGSMGAFPSMDSDSSGHIHMVYELLTPATPPDKDNYEIWYRNSVP
jgi:hypothetical protein